MSGATHTARAKTHGIVAYGVWQKFLVSDLFLLSYWCLGKTFARTQISPCEQRSLSSVVEQLVLNKLSTTSHQDVKVEYIKGVTSGVDAATYSTEVSMVVAKRHMAGPFPSSSCEDDKCKIESALNSASLDIALRQQATFGTFDTITAAGMASSDIVGSNTPKPRTTRTTTSTTTLFTPEDLGMSSGVTILMCTAIFLFIAMLAVFIRYAIMYEDDTKGSFEVSGEKGTTVVEGIYSPQRSRGNHLRAEPLASPENFIASRHPANKSKNRSEDHLPYDATRVRLNVPETHAPFSDYINASVVPGYKERWVFICVCVGARAKGERTCRVSRSCNT